MALVSDRPRTGAVMWADLVLSRPVGRNTAGDRGGGHRYLKFHDREGSTASVSSDPADSLTSYNSSIAGPD